MALCSRSVKCLVAYILHHLVGYKWIKKGMNQLFFFFNLPCKVGVRKSFILLLIKKYSSICCAEFGNACPYHSGKYCPILSETNLLVNKEVFSAVQGGSTFMRLSIVFVLINDKTNHKGSFSFFSFGKMKPIISGALKISLHVIDSLIWWLYSNLLGRNWKPKEVLNSFNW